MRPCLESMKPWPEVAHRRYLWRTGDGVLVFEGVKIYGIVGILACGWAVVIYRKYCIQFLSISSTTMTHMLWLMPNLPGSTRTSSVAAGFAAVRLFRLAFGWLSWPAKMSQES